MNQPVQNPYRFLLRRLAIWLKGSASFLWLFVLAAYLLVLAGNAFYRNYQAQQETQTLQNQLAQDKIEKERLEALLVYYQTDSYKEKELRRTLLLKGKGETVYALPESSAAKTVEQAITEAVVPQNDTVSSLPIWHQWFDYLWYGRKG